MLHAITGAWYGLVAVWSAGARASAASVTLGGAPADPLRERTRTGALRHPPWRPSEKGVSSLAFLPQGAKSLEKVGVSCGNLPHVPRVVFHDRRHAGGKSGSFPGVVSKK
jgi:hypothetical protein